MIGETLGQYRVTEKIGEGGMGVVYAADHLTMGYKAAVKVLLPNLSNDQTAVARFFNEARAASVIKHPALVHIFDSGYAANGMAYIVMEYLEGEMLAMRLRRDGRMPAETAVSIGQQVASALSAVHEKGIIHRDLKPENLFLVTDTRVPAGFVVKVLDFGIAKLTGPESFGSGVKTKTGSVLGTPSYMSPEQCRGSGQIDWRSDIYSLGCILYELACGQPPFHGAGFGEVLAKHIYEPPTKPSIFDPRIPPKLENAIMKSLAKQADQRWQSMDELLLQLDSMSQVQYSHSGQFATSSMPAMSREQLDSLQGVQAPATTTTTMGGSAGEAVRAEDVVVKPKSRSKTPILVGALLAVAGGAVGVIVVMSGKSSPETPSSASAATAAPVAEPAPPPTPAPSPPAPAPASAPEPAPAPASAPAAAPPPVAALVTPDAAPPDAKSAPAAAPAPQPEPAVEVKPPEPAPEAKPAAAEPKPKPAAKPGQPAAKPAKPIKDGVLNPFSK